MNETVDAARLSWRRLKKALREADEDTRFFFYCWATGHVLIAMAIILQFGWFGAMFCIGLFLIVITNKAVGMM